MAKRRGRGEGTIYQRADGRWAASVDLGFRDGKRRRKDYYGATRAAVSAKLIKAQGRQQQGGVVDTNDLITVAAYLDRWLPSAKVRPKTKRQYEQIVRLYLRPSLGPVKLARLDPDQVRAMVDGLEARGLSTRTATLARDVLRIALAQAVRDQVLIRNVAALVRRPKPRRRELTTLSADESRALLTALRGHRLEAVVTCGVALGLRLGEALGLQWADVDFSTGKIAVRRALHAIGKQRELDDLKSRESRRTLALPTVVRRALEAHRKRQAEKRLAAGADWQRSDFVFTTGTGRPLEPTLVTRDLKRILARTWTGADGDCEHERLRDRECPDCGARRLPALSFHGLRHSCASLLLAAGVPLRDVSELLGHSDTRLTLQTYAHVLDENRARTAGITDRVFDSQSDSHTDGHGRTEQQPADRNTA